MSNRYRDPKANANGGVVTEAFSRGYYRRSACAKPVHTACAASILENSQNASVHAVQSIGHLATGVLSIVLAIASVQLENIHNKPLTDATQGWETDVQATHSSDYF